MNTKTKAKKVSSKTSIKKIANENPHAKYSPSALEHIEVCPGYEKESGDNKFSEEGTMLHKACQSGRTTTLDKEQNHIVSGCLDYVKRFISKDTLKDLREVRLDVEALTWGTADRLLIQGDNSADLFDYKFGRNAVDDAETNLQGWCYALGVFSQFKVGKVTVHFLLPRRDEISTHTITREDVPAIRLRIATVIARRKEYEKTTDPKMLRASPPNCIYCGAKARCAALHSIAFRIAKKYDETFSIPEEVHSSQIQDPKEMAKAKAIAVVMDKWVGSVNEHALQMVLNGTELPGWEMKHRMGKLKIADARAAYSACKQVIRSLTLEEFVAHVSVSKSALETLIADRAAMGEKAGMVRELNEALIDMGVGVRDPDTQYLGRVKE